MPLSGQGSLARPKEVALRMGRASSPDTVRLARGIPDSLGHELLTHLRRDLSLVDLFVGRSHLIRLFCTKLHEVPNTPQVLFFHGEGGNGKSWLLRFLRDRCCKLLYAHHWNKLKGLPDHEFVARVVVAHGEERVPWAEIDFADPIWGEEARNPFAALTMLRRSLGASRLRFPVFDFAYMCYLRKANRLTDDQLRSVFPSEAVGFARDLIGAFHQVTGLEPVTLVLKHVAKLFGGEFELWSRTWGVDRRYLEIIQGLDQRDLGGRLPEILARDILSSMALKDTPRRLVLFVDGYERLWGSDAYLAAFQGFHRDQWLRQLVKPLLHPAGCRILVVIAGRMPPSWPDTGGEHTVPSDLILAYPVKPLGADDSREYLARRGITDEALQEAILWRVQTAPGEFHPMYLGLCADTVLFAAENGRVTGAEELRQQAWAAGRETEVLGRLLSEVGTDFESAIVSLSACRAFDYDIYTALGRSLGFEHDRARFRFLTSFFSFAWKTQREGGEWYRLHDLVRRLMRNNPERADEMAKADEVLQAYHRRRAGSRLPASFADAIYHGYHLDQRRGTEEWLEFFDCGGFRADHLRAQALHSIRGDISPSDPRLQGRVAAANGLYLLSLARYEEAEGELRVALVAYDKALARVSDEADVHSDKGRAFRSLGDLEVSLSRHVETEESFRLAVAAFDETIILRPGAIGAYVGKASALRSLGDLWTNLSRHDEALECYATAIAAYEEALTRSPVNIEAQSGRGSTLRSLGDLQAGLARLDEAESSFRLAIAACDEVLRQTHGDILVRNEKSIALRGLSDVQASRSQADEAEQLLRLAITTLDEALRWAPDYPATYNNKGNALQHLGDLMQSRSRHIEARRSYRLGIAAFNEALRLVPARVEVHSNKGIALHGLGDLQAAASEHGAAEESYTAAIASYDEALSRAPDFVKAHNNRGNALWGLANLLVRLSRDDEAERRYSQAIDAFEAALDRAPGWIGAHNNKGNALERFAELLADLSRVGEAKDAYTRSIAAFDEVLTRAPMFAAGHANKAVTLQRFGDLQVDLSQSKEAERLYRLAIAACDEALGVAPAYAEFHSIKANALRRLADLQASASRHREAEVYYARALAAFDATVSLAPDYAEGHSDRGCALKNLGDLHGNLPDPRPGAGERFYALALAAFDKALRLAPGYVEAHNSKADALRSLGDLQAHLSQTVEAERSYSLAVAACDRTLRLAPKRVAALVSKSNTLIALGLCVQPRGLGQARRYWARARGVLARAMELRPEHRSVLRALRLLTHLLEGGSRHDQHRPPGWR
jgi:tetratricopeptide (TPR) repeat protein